MIYPTKEELERMTKEQLLHIIRQLKTQNTTNRNRYRNYRALHIKNKGHYNYIIKKLEFLRDYTPVHNEEKVKE